MRSTPRGVGERGVQVAAIEAIQNSQGDDADHFTARLYMGEQRRYAQASLKHAPGVLLGFVELSKAGFVARNRGLERGTVDAGWVGPERFEQWPEALGPLLALPGSGLGRATGRKAYRHLVAELEEGVKVEGCGVLRRRGRGEERREIEWHFLAEPGRRLVDSPGQARVGGAGSWVAACSAAAANRIKVAPAAKVERIAWCFVIRMLPQVANRSRRRRITHRGDPSSRATIRHLPQAYRSAQIVILEYRRRIRGTR